MPKSICIKTNNHQDIIYIIGELQNLKINNVYFSCKNFKSYTNIIIHYTGKSIPIFYYAISKILTYLVLDLYENHILKKLIYLEYFYFSLSEQNEILHNCIDSLNYDDTVNRLETIQNSFLKYIEENKSLNLNGFINFRLSSYISYLDSIVDICVNKFIIDKEYTEFISLLKAYVCSSKTNSRYCSSYI